MLYVYCKSIIEDYCMWSLMLSIFPRGYKLSMGVSSMWVLKRSLETSRIRQGQHSIRSLPYVGFLFCVLKCKCDILEIVYLV